MLTPEIKNTFRELYDQSPRLITYLQELIQKTILNTPEDIGFCYWNISDHYALMRNGTAVYSNHNTFYQYLTAYHTKYLYWLVCDATQKYALEDAGYTNFWWELYHQANEKNLPEKDWEAIAFTAHRAALSLRSGKQAETYHLDAKEQFQCFLQHTRSSESYTFYHLIYHSLCLRAFRSTEEPLELLCEPWYSFLSLSKTERPYEIGEWNSFNETFNRHWQANIGICAAVNALIDTEQNKIAKMIYTKAQTYGLPQNAYIEKRI